MKKLLPFKVGQFVVEPERFCMREGARTIDVSKRLMQLLVFLAERPGEVVTKEELLDQIWSDVIVSDDTIRKTISDLRILFQQHDGSINIESVRGVGYRLLTPIEQAPLPSSPENVRLLWSIGFILALGLAALSYWSVMTKQAHRQMSSRLNQAAVSTAVRWSVEGELLSFVKKENDRQQLVVQKEQFHEIPLLESGPTLHPEAVFAPDGKALIYLDRQSTGKVIRRRNLLDMTEQNVHYVKHTPPLSSLDWSASGTQIVWSEARTDGPYQLQTSTPEGEGKEVLTFPPADYIGDMQARFSPSGQQLCFIRYSRPVSSYHGILPGLGQLYVKDLESGAELPLLEREMVLGGLHWIDEQTVAYIARDFYTFGVHTIDLRSRAKQTIYTSARALRHLERWEDFLWTEEWQEHYAFLRVKPGELAPHVAFPTDLKCWHPTYSPDGTQLAYVTKGEQAYELRLRQLNQEKEEVLFAAPMPILSPQWSPRSNALVFMLDGSETGICTYELSTRKVIPLTKGDYPIWNEDGTAIYYMQEVDGIRQLIQQTALAGSPANTILALPAKRAWPYQNDWLFSHEAEPGLWQYTSATGQVQQIIPDFHPKDTPNWLILEDNLYYWTRIGIQSLSLKRYNFKSGKTTILLHRSSPLPYDFSGFAIHPNLGDLLFPAEQEIENKLLPIPFPSGD